jgi:hypothetical protein
MVQQLSWLLVEELLMEVATIEWVVFKLPTRLLQSLLADKLLQLVLKAREPILS